MSVETRLRDPEYQNWLKCGQALRIVVDGVRQFANDTVQSYHDALKNQLGSSTCNKQCPAKKLPPNTCAVCTSWTKEMKANHSTKQFFWTNVDPKKWPNDKWEMAKFYMPRGQKPNIQITASDLDSTHMLNLIKNCKEFHKHLFTKKLPEKVLQVRNHLMHSPTMTIPEGKLQEDFKVFLQFLQDSKRLHRLPEAQKSVQELHKLLKMDLLISFKNQGARESAQQALTVDEVRRLEKDLIRDRMNDFEARLEAIENSDTSTEGTVQDSNTKYQILSENIADLQAFVDDNLDLKALFGTELQSIKSKCEDLEEWVEKINQEVEILQNRVDNLENNPSESDSEISPDTEPAGLDPFMLKAIKRTAPVVLCLVAVGIALMQHQSLKRNSLPDKLPAASYKNLLQEITQKFKAEKPSYACSHDEYGFKCTVSVLDEKYTGPDYHRTQQDAEQNAAKGAYSILKIRKVAETTKLDDINYKGNLQEHQAKYRLGIPTYETMQDDGKFRAKVTVPMPDGKVEVFVTDTAEGSKKVAKHQAAKKALESLNALGDLPKPPAKTLVVKSPEAKIPVERSQVVKASTTGATHKVMKAVPQDDSTSDTNFKGKLQEHQQKCELANPTYETTADGTKFRAKVTVPMPDDEVKEFVTDTAEGSKREAEHKVAKIALESLSALGELPKPSAKTPVVKTPATTVPGEDSPAGKSQAVKTPDAGHTPKVKKTSTPKVRKTASQDDSSSDSSQNFKGDLQILLQKSNSGLPKYEDIEDPTKPGTYRSQVTVNTKYILQNDRYYPSKKEAEKYAAKHALMQLEVPDWDTVDNPKGKLQEVKVSPKPYYHTEEVQPKQFQCTLILSSLNKVNKVVIYADLESKTKKERQKAQQLAAKKMLDLLRHLELV